MKKKLISIICILILMNLIAGCASPLHTNKKSLKTSSPKEVPVNSIETPLPVEKACETAGKHPEKEGKEIPLPQEKEQEQKSKNQSPITKTPQTSMQMEKPKENPKETGTLNSTATKKPETQTATYTPKPVTSENPQMTAEPTSKPTPKPTPEIEVMGSSFNSAVLAAINAARAENGNAPMVLDGGLCAKALAHAKEMAERGEIYHSCGGAESVSNAAGSGSTIGTRSAAHATGLALDADRSRLGVGSVKIGDKQYTCVFSPIDD